MTQNQGPPPYWIDPDSTEIYFPDVELALLEPDGLLAVGGDLSSERLLYAYSKGIFPWYGPDQPILWWSPNPRLVLFPTELHVSHSLAKKLRQKLFTVTIDTAFDQVISECAAYRQGQAGTWITAEMQAAYTQLYYSGHAHSVETWLDGELVGGLYGLALGRVFFGESMFAQVADASKVGFVTLVRQLQRREFRLIDCQVHTDHLVSLGATTIPRHAFVNLLQQHCNQADSGKWVLDDSGH